MSVWRVVSIDQRRGVVTVTSEADGLTVELAVDSDNIRRVSVGDTLKLLPQADA